MFTGNIQSLENEYTVLYIERHAGTISLGGDGDLRLLLPVAQGVHQLHELVLEAHQLLVLLAALLRRWAVGKCAWNGEDNAVKASTAERKIRK
jgi:hypothetical protein